MKPDQQRIAIAEACGWVWYRLPNARENERTYRCLFLPAIHEYEGQSARWLVKADGTERICNMEYMVREGHLPDYVRDLNAMREAEQSIEKDKREEYAEMLCSFLPEGFCDLAGTAEWIFAVSQLTAAQRAEAFLRTIGKFK